MGPTQKLRHPAIEMVVSRVAIGAGLGVCAHSTRTRVCWSSPLLLRVSFSLGLPAFTQSASKPPFPGSQSKGFHFGGRLLAHLLPNGRRRRAQHQFYVRLLAFLSRSLSLAHIWTKRCTRTVSFRPTASLAGRLGGLGSHEASFEEGR